MKITKITSLYGKESRITMFDGLYFQDIEYARIDIMRYLRCYSDREHMELEITYDEMPICGLEEHQDNLENW